MKHDEKKIKKLLADEFNYEKDCLEIQIIKQYAEHMVQQKRERIIKILETGMNTKNNYNMKYSDFIKAINQDL